MDRGQRGELQIPRLARSLPIHLLPQFPLLHIKKESPGKEIFSTVGELCPGSCKTLPSSASFCVIFTYPGIREILLREVVRWVTHLQVSCKGSRERKRTRRLPSTHPEPGRLVHRPAVPRAGNQAGSSSSSPGVPLLKKDQRGESRSSTVWKDYDLLFFFFFCRVFVFKRALALLV